ncbi:hypothetical protein [Methanobrevibacter sp.]|uniref:hypothetical protein n=1 Tax=Methanobrevibacter sp. TaxID=66852 RepID=UPI002E75D134|nr:hypothetical protein [Methanobrevibacter sp.]MEE1335516.1 hypothetical protein [Methanobrevibacter sp.]
MKIIQESPSSIGWGGSRPVRWVTAYLLINIVIYPIGFGLAKKVFGFDPMVQ